MARDKFNTLAYDDEQINDELVDALIKAGSHEYIQNSILEVPDAELSDQEFSEELDQKLHEYFDKLDKSDQNEKIKYLFTKTKNVMLRAAAVLLVLIALAAGFVATSEAAQMTLLRMYIEHSNIDSSFEFIAPDETQNNSYQQTPIPESQQIESMEYMFWYVPSGFELIYEDHSEDIKILTYENMEGDYLEIMQMSGGNLKVDSETDQNYSIEVNGITCFVSEHEDRILVVFNIEDKNYNITSNLPIEEIEKVIENMNY